MNYPNQPAGYPPYPPQQNPQGAPGYGYPPQPGYPPQGYAPQYPPQGYAPAPQQPVLARGTLEDYLDQPTGGGGAATSKFFTPQRPQGSWLQLRVARDFNNNDVRQQTDKFGQPLTFKSNGKPKFVLIIPCQVLSSSDGSHVQVFPEGQCTVWLKGVPSDAFKQAMSAAGITDPARALVNGFLGGAEFYMISAGTKQYGNGNPANMFDFRYTPGGREMNEPNPTVAAPAAAALPQAPAVAPPPAYAQPAPPTTAPVTIPQTAPPAPAGYGPPVTPPAPPAPPTAPPPPAQYAQQPPPSSGAPQGFQPPPAPPAPGAPPAPPAGYAPQQLDPEKAALLQRLQGQQQ